MRRIEIKRWNGRFQHPNTVQKIRKKIAGTIKSDRTVLLDFEGVKKLTPELVLQIIDGWNERKVKIITCGKERQ